MLLEKPDLKDPISLTEYDRYLFRKGTHYQLYNVMGGRLKTIEGCQGALFRLWAPNARSVSLIGDFNCWNGKDHPMEECEESGVWSLFVPGLKEGERYKFQVTTHDEKVMFKSDPHAYFSEKRPQNASRLFDLDQFEWSDETWMRNRNRKRNRLNVYEIHLGSWKKNMNYRELAHALAQYCLDMGFTHIELLPIAEHPLDESWGYQVTGFYAATSRFGTPRDFQYLVNYLHLNGIGVILDWVSAHFATDDFGLICFDGTFLYEHSDWNKRVHPHWGTHIFNYGRHEVSNFLLGSALFWLDKMHLDGLRIDAVASMLYLDYGREEGEWSPNREGGKENIEAIEFLKHLNSITHQLFPDCIICAEESTQFPLISYPVEWGGLGFDLKWNMGWMNDALRYFQIDPLFRHHHQNTLTFPLIYAFSERFILTLSHDEVVHGKKSLLSKMPGDDWQKFAQLRLLYSYLICHPGKKLSFMGVELGQWEEWNCTGEIDWYLLKYERHKQLQATIRALNHLYLHATALWENDHQIEGFEWVDFNDTENCVIAFFRKSTSQSLLCVHHFTPSYIPKYRIPILGIKEAYEIFNTDAVQFGGSGKVNEGPLELTFDERGKETGFQFQLSPLATLIFKVSFHE